ncbi:tyrosine-type recombinase/integrase [Haloarchaeobius sp. HRN-SO-5]|uniref:tyrosine-type recombinase/integrase n=1 Tax=Haloarchaeobius sp. HRN-SO-5 TaxID=3446118 RepID=UPI003EB7B049
MQMEDYPEREDGKKVWLRPEEVKELLGEIGDTERRIALGLMARSGLRSHEVVDVTADDVVDTPIDQTFVRVWAGKGSKYRESPVPQSLAATIRAYSDVREESSDEPLVDRPTRTLRRWVRAAADARREATGDKGWSFLGPHDLRRTWGTLLVEAEVEPGLVMEFGGWDDWETFREAYLGAYSLKAKKDGIGKVDWL